MLSLEEGRGLVAHLLVEMLRRSDYLGLGVTCNTPPSSLFHFLMEFVLCSYYAPHQTLLFSNLQMDILPSQIDFLLPPPQIYLSPLPPPPQRPRRPQWSPSVSPHQTLTTQASRRKSRSGDDFLQKCALMPTTGATPAQELLLVIWQLCGELSFAIVWRIVFDNYVENCFWQLCGELPESLASDTHGRWKARSKRSCKKSQN